MKPQAEANQSHKRPAGLSLDLDNQWSYMKTHGDMGWEVFPSYLDTVLPRAIGLLEKLDLTITFFVVGQDAQLEKNHAALRSITAVGHEVGNHSFHHEPWFHRLTEERIEDEIATTEQLLDQVTGFKPVGYRAPGYSLSGATLRVLRRRGYQYDCSTFPTFIGPLARLYYFLTAQLKADEKEERSKLFGTLREGFLPNKPYTWQMTDGTLPEIPVTTIPIIRMPFHFSYILYIAKFSPLAARLYFIAALLLCRLTGTSPSLLLHPLDFLTVEDVPELAFFPAMQMPLDKKLQVLEDVLLIFKRNFEVLPMGKYAERLTSRKLRLRKPVFPSDEVLT